MPIASERGQADWARRQLAAIAVVRRQPGRAGRLLAAVDTTALTDKGRRQYDDLRQRIAQLQREDILEILD